MEIDNMQYNILIPTSLYDVHAIAVEYALKNLDSINVFRWFGSDFPTRQQQTFFATDNKTYFSVQDKKLNFNLSDIDLVWYRRPGNIFVDLDKAHPDYTQVMRENNHFSRNFWELIPDSTKWVNHYINARKADNKLGQLKVASSCGLNIPDTISSNDPEKIKGFITKCDTKVIYKAFSGLKDWEENGKILRQHATPVDLKDLPDDEMLKLSSGIFQKYIKKEYELRIFYLDGRCIAAKIATPKKGIGQHDWREANISSLKIEPYELPDSLVAQINKFMNQLGLVTGSLDMIKAINGDYIFLEVNESGQFLWLELENPEIRVLGPYCKFLCEQASSGAVSIEQRRIIAKNIFNQPDFGNILESDLKLHVNTQ